jgi:hypothetical protein
MAYGLLAGGFLKIYCMHRIPDDGIRGDLQTDLGQWQNLDNMELGIVSDGVFGVKLKVRKETSFLIYDKPNDTAYGYAKLSSENTTACSRGEKGSITLTEGEYYIQMSKVGRSITIIKES